jgi:hypothetical protein
MSFKAAAISAALGLSAMLGAEANAATIVNGDFSSGLSGWTVGGAVIAADGATYNPCCGTPVETTPTFAAFGPGNVTDVNTLSQTFSTDAGKTYTVSFESGALGGGSQNLSYAVTGAGVAGGTVTENADDSLVTTFKPTIFKFLSTTTGSTTLTFTDASFADGVDPVLTDVSLAVPEPATWATMLVGLFGLGATMRAARRRTAAALA